jgi:hypothetical protein
MAKFQAAGLGVHVFATETNAGELSIVTRHRPRSANDVRVRQPFLAGRGPMSVTLQTTMSVSDSHLVLSTRIGARSAPVKRFYIAGKGNDECRRSHK